MRTFRFPLFLLALLLGLSLNLGCLREAEEPESDQAAIEQEEAYDDAEAKPGEALEAHDPELQPEQRIVVVEPEPGPDAGAQRDLEALDRRIAERQAALDARERRLRERERAQREAPAPEPVPEEVIEEPAAAPKPEPAPEPEPEPEIAPAEPEAPAAPREVRVPAGTVLNVEILEGLSSQSSQPGEIFRARVSSDVTADGGVAIPAGSEVVGVVTEAVPLRKIGGRAKLALKFTDLVLPSGSTVPLRASVVQQGRSETGRDAATIGGAAAGGAILGRVINKGDRSKGGLIGAVIGAAAGAVIASRTPGEAITIPEGTRLDLKLDDEVEVRLQR
jgi:type IV secretory pathway VirB10-like protein